MSDINQPSDRVERDREPFLGPRKKEKSFGKKLMILFPVIIMVLSVLAFSLSFTSNNNQDTQEEYPEIIIQSEDKSYTFYEIDNGTTYLTGATIAGQEIPVQFNLDPREADSILLDDTAVLRALGASKIYMSFSPNSSDLGRIGVAVFQVSRILGMVYNIETVGAYTHDANPIDPNIPIKTCEDATNTIPVMVFEVDETSKEDKVILENNCIRIIGKDYDGMAYAADKLGMYLLDIRI